MNSCYANEPHKIKIQGEQFVMISPVDAEKRNIREGDPVRVQNDRGDFEGVARVTEDVNPGIVVATLGYWRSAQSLGRIGELDLVGCLVGPRPRADVLRQPRRGLARQLTRRQRPVRTFAPRQQCRGACVWAPQIAA